jgi:hypothetical protein
LLEVDVRVLGHEFLPALGEAEFGIQTPKLHRLSPPEQSYYGRQALAHVGGIVFAKIRSVDVRI